MFKDWRGFLVPSRDSERVLERRVVQCTVALNWIVTNMQKRDFCIQAGGNWGYWPMMFAKLFGTVYSFEPDGICFACLTHNTREAENVVRLQAAVGLTGALPVGLKRDKDTTGNQRCIPDGGIYPTLAIDALNLPACDLIYLDVEGMEQNALRGATRTLFRCKPYVAFEVTQALDPDGRVETMMAADYGYKRIGAIDRDVVMAPC